MFVLTPKSIVVACAAFLLVTTCIPQPVSAEKREKNNVVVTVGEMCGGCVKRITKRLDKEKEIAKVVCSVEKKTVTIVAKKGKRLSPKGIWEIMDSIGKTPKKLVSPEGTFTSKPKK